MIIAIIILLFMMNLSLLGYVICLDKIVKNIENAVTELQIDYYKN